MSDAARKAARGLNRDFGELSELQVSRKAPADFVSAGVWSHPQGAAAAVQALTAAIARGLAGRG